MRRYYIGLTSIVLAALTATTAMAATWRPGTGSNQNRWWYEEDNGTYARSEWRWLDGNQDGIAECYAFDEDGWMYADTTTPDGYQVNRDGAWEEDGAVQTQKVPARQVQVNSDSRVLVVYFSQPETDGTDTNSGASRVLTNGQVQGNVEYMANIIGAEAGADLFRINTVQNYPGLHEPLVNQAAEELSRNFRPELSALVPNPEDYDIIFAGYPNWWGDMPMPVYSFFDNHDLTGKTVIPFTCHGGSGFADTVNRIAELEPGANVLRNGYAVERSRVAGDGENIRTWAAGLNLDN